MLFSVCVFKSWKANIWEVNVAIDYMWAALR